MKCFFNNHSGNPFMVYLLSSESSDSSILVSNVNIRSAISLFTVRRLLKNNFYIHDDIFNKPNKEIIENGK